jgi:hypothetical protein
MPNKGAKESPTATTESSKKEGVHVGPTLSALFTGAVFGAGLLWAAHHELQGISDRMASLEAHIRKVETAVRIVAAKQQGDTKTLVDEALTVAKNASDAGQVENAKTSLEIANRLLAEQKATRVPAPPDFFDSTLRSFSRLKRLPLLANSAREGTLTLAEYRSATSSLPVGQPESHIGEMRREDPFLVLKDSVIGPHTLYQPKRGVGEGFELDYLFAENVVFHDLTIVYSGGPMKLRNVSFVNCLFVVPKVEAGDQLLQAVIQQPADLNIG